MSRADDGLFDAAVWRPAIEKFAAATHLTVSIYAAGERVAIGPVCPTPLFELLHQHAYDPGILAGCARARIAQEALNNVAKHAAATRVALILERRGERAVLVVEDNGRGFDVRASADPTQQRLGVTGMRERAQLASGTLEVESEPGKGTSVIVRIPLRTAES